MEFIEKACVMDAAGISRALSRLACEIVEFNRGVENLLLVGIRRRGVPLAERIALKIEALEGESPAVASIDITLYRDDLSLVGPKPVVRETTVPADITGWTAVLVDDVLFTGRTVRAAIDHLFDYGRPKRVMLAVLIDRGHRELPLHADFIGKTIPTRQDEIIKVMLSDFDEAEKVVIVTQPPAETGVA